MNEKKHYNITVTGKVQGVWFRVSTRDMAIQLGLNGIVKNQPDGSVYIEAEGTTKQLQALLEWCKIGPDLARVECVSFVHGEVIQYTNFSIA